MQRAMEISIHVHDRSPAALAELIRATLPDGVELDREAPLGHFPAVVAAGEREAERRRAEWRWLNSLSQKIDRDNDWSEI